LIAGNKKGGENKMELLYENEYIQIRLDDLHKCIEYQWKKHAPAEELKNLMLKIYGYVSKHSCDKLLPDLRNLDKLPEDIRLWAESDWFPRLIKQGVRIYAIVKHSYDWNGDAMERLYPTTITSRTKLGITTAYFDDLIKARSWISKLGTN
jgi:hypothetical protein